MVRVRMILEIVGGSVRMKKIRVRSLVRPAVGCIGLRTNDIGHPCATFVVRTRMAPLRDRRIALLAQSLGIFRMKDLIKLFRVHFVFRQAGVLQYRLIGV